jgi:predicted transglutaminase-like cysteine proteinase
MSAFTAARAGAFAIICVFSTLSAPARAAAYALRESVTDAAEFPAPAAVEPFGLPTSTLTEGPLRSKWQTVERTIAAEADVIAGCATDPAHCTSQPALRFLDIVQAASAREGLARLGEINRAINLAIRPVSDRAQYGVEDHWSSPLATLAAGAGDCEDYAIAKLVALRAAGVAADDLRLIIIRETATGDDHAMVAARFEGRWRMLDNRTFLMIEDNGFGKYRPLFAIDAEGAKRFEQPMFADAAPITQSRPAEIETRDPVVDAGTQAIGSNTAAVALDEFCMTLAL